MLFLLAYFLVISLICLWAGLLWYGLTSEGPVVRDPPPVMIMITGLMLLTAGGEWLALFIPLKPWCIPVLLLLLQLLASFRKVTVYEKFGRMLRNLKPVYRPVWYGLSLVGLLILVLMFNAGPSRMDDTESYHIQAIKWIQSFGSVPGIANLHQRFGFNSAWFSTVGLFTYSSNGLNGYLSMNGVICFWFCLYLSDRFAAATRPGPAAQLPGQAIGILLLLVFSLGNWYILRRSAASTSYDFIATMAVVILLLESNGEEHPPPEWLIWPLFLFTVRIMLFPFLLLPLAFCFRKSPAIKRNRWMLTGFIAAFFILPFIARNIILSGFPFFPLTVLDWYKADWKTDPILAANITEYIRYFNRVNPMFESIAETRQRGNWGWIGSWWKYLFTVDKATMIAGGAGYLLFFFRKEGISRNMRVMVTVIVVALLVWFGTAPDPRFVQGIFLAGIFFGAVVLFRSTQVNRGLLQWAFCLAGFCCAGYSAFTQHQGGTQTSLLLPTPLPVPPVREMRAGKILLHIPDKILGNWNPRCYDVDLPCLYLPDPRLRPRGDRLADGFRLDTTAAPGSESFGGEYKIK